MLKIENVTKYYGNFLAVDNLSFTVEPGEIFGLLGVNGAGKTTTFRMIMGLLDKNAGTITLNDKPINYDVTDNIGFLTEERSLLTKLTVREQAVMYGVLKGLTEKEVNKRLVTLLEKFGVPEYIDKKIKELSKGNQQKIQFITAIINEPKLLILDEPFSGLDPLNVDLFMGVIRDLSKNGTMIIFSSHRMEHVELFCQKLVILVEGRTVLEGKLKDIKKDYRKKNIVIKGDVKSADLKEIKGVEKVVKSGDSTYNVTIAEEKITEKVFDYVKKCKNITEFAVEEASLNDIFVSIVGSSYEN